MLSLLPLPGFKAFPIIVKVFLVVSLAVSIGFATNQSSPSNTMSDDGLVQIMAELFRGIGISLVATFAIEALIFSGQIIAVQVGLSYAAVIDPFSESDSGILPSLMGLLSGLLLFQSELYAGLIRSLALTVNRGPGGSGASNMESARSLIEYCVNCLQMGLRLALPVMALLLFVDICMGLFGRLQPQIQFLPLSFSMKLLGAMAALAGLMPAYGYLYARVAGSSAATLQAFLK